MLTCACTNLVKARNSESERPDIESMVSSGLFEECASAVAFVAASGVEKLHDVAPTPLMNALTALIACRDHPGCEARIRSIAQAITFCLENSLDVVSEMGNTSGSMAAQLCCGVFGRDEGGSEFTFTSEHVDMLVTRWMQLVRGELHRARLKPTADNIMIADLCVSDKNKPLLLQNAKLLPYLVDALLLDPEHPRAGLQPDLKAWCQLHHCEALAQLAVFSEGREALLADPTVYPALEAVAEDGLCDEAKHHASAALFALGDTKITQSVEGQKHVMLSCASCRSKAG
eukprot:COSAG02_NODE_1670_length_11394_cov_4.791855_4_plen_287_part_00